MKRLSQSLEDYLEALYLLSREKQVVRVKDLVKQMQVRSPSVIGAINRLMALGLVEYEHHSHVALTKPGEEKAKHIYRRHMLLFSFLKDVLGVSPETAGSDACKIEHLVSGETLEQMEKFLLQNPLRPPQEDISKSD